MDTLDYNSVNILITAVMTVTSNMFDTNNSTRSDVDNGFILMVDA